MSNRVGPVVRQVDFAAVAAPARQKEAQGGVDAQPNPAARQGTRISHGSRLVHQRSARQPLRLGPPAAVAGQAMNALEFPALPNEVALKPLLTGCADRRWAPAKGLWAGLSGSTRPTGRAS